MKCGSAGLNIMLETTLQINPSGNLPFKHKKFGRKVEIINLQPSNMTKTELIIC